jgi:predicted TIM-barrel fold metal-dependent hydrolase
MRAWVADRLRRQEAIQSVHAMLTRILCAVLLMTPVAALAQAVDTPRLRADHHMHLASADLCARVGECLDSNDPPAVYAVDAVRALDEGRVDKGVVLSSAYLYGLDSLRLAPAEVARLTRAENEFTAAQIAAHPDRLVGFLSVDPLEPAAVAEIEHWRGSSALRGLKLHFAAASVDLKRESDRLRVAEVLDAASGQGLPMVIHIGGEAFGRTEAAIFLRDVLPHAVGSDVQIAHAGGGMPMAARDHIAVLNLFADRIEAGDPATARLLFELSFVPLPGEDAAARAQVLQAMRRIGIGRFLFGSDFNIEMPLAAQARIRSLGLTAQEWQQVTRACAPWVCRGS